MKKTRSVDKARNGAKPNPGTTLSDEKHSDLLDESADLSTERIMEGASAKTAVLNQILAQQAEFHEVRYWGINE